MFTNQLMTFFPGWTDYFQIVTGVYQEIAKKDHNFNKDNIDSFLEYDDTSDSGVLESHKLAMNRLNRTRVITQLRKFIDDNYIDKLLWEFLSTRFENEEDFTTSIVNNGNYFYSLWQEFEEGFFNGAVENLKGLSATKLSSIGRSIQMFYSTIDHPVASRLDADPFSFYMFSRVPTYGKPITEF